MTAETARQFEALERQAQKLMAVFVQAGHEAVAPAMIQPADIFLDCIGEALRARTYVFNDPEGRELCLRPDLTMPTCRLHLARDPQCTSPGRYCYNGAAFRFQPEGADNAHPREFRQAGIERIGEAPREQDEAETLALILRALAAAGLEAFELKFGDLGFFNALLAAVDMPERWRLRLLHTFWRRDAFRAELKRLASNPGSSVSRSNADIVAELGAADPKDAEDIVARRLDAAGIELVGSRTLSEITANLLGQAADAKARPLASATAELIDRYVSISGSAKDSVRHLETLVRGSGLDIKTALASFDHRLVRLANIGVDLGKATFAAEFGRSLEYYTGFVFEVLAPTSNGASPIAGGGRYDGLMRAAGAPRDIPAVGAAIHTERLLAAVGGDSANGDRS
jgi:ATP phosphoribosyltransferase regulatory subunit